MNHTYFMSADDKAISKYRVEWSDETGKIHYEDCFGPAETVGLAFDLVNEGSAVCAKAQAYNNYRSWNTCQTFSVEN